MAETEKIIIRANLIAMGGNKSRTAEVLGIGRKTLHRKIKNTDLKTNSKNKFHLYNPLDAFIYWNIQLLKCTIALTELH